MRVTANIDPLVQKVLLASTAVRNFKFGRQPDPSWDLETAVTELLKSASDEEFMALVLGGHIPTANRATFGTLVSLAATYGRTELVIALATSGCDVMTPNADNVTPLEVACRRLMGPASGKAVAALLEVGASVGDRRTPLACAAQEGRGYIVEALLGLGHNPNELCFQNGMPLPLALYAVKSPEYVHTVRALIAAGATCDDAVETPLTTPGEKAQAATQTMLELAVATTNAQDLTKIRQVVDVLIEHGGELDAAPGRLGPLEYCMVEGNDALALALLERGADPSRSRHTYVKSSSVFQQAALIGLQKTVAFMLDNHDEDPQQTLRDGSKLIDKVNPTTRAQLLSAAARKAIGATMEDLGSSTAAPRTPKSTPSL